MITYSGERKEKQEGYWRKGTSPSTHFYIALTFEIMLMFYVFEKKIKLTTMERDPKSEYKQQEQQT